MIDDLVNTRTGGQALPRVGQTLRTRHQVDALRGSLKVGPQADAGADLGTVVMDTDVAGEGLAEVDIAERLRQYEETARRQGGDARAGGDLAFLSLLKHVSMGQN